MLDVFRYLTALHDFAGYYCMELFGASKYSTSILKQLQEEKIKKKFSGYVSRKQTTVVTQKAHPDCEAWRGE